MIGIEALAGPAILIKFWFRERCGITAEDIKVRSQWFNPIQQIGPLFLRQLLIQLGQNIYSDGGIDVDFVLKFGVSHAFGINDKFLHGGLESGVVVPVREQAPGFGLDYFTIPQPVHGNGR